MRSWRDICLYNGFIAKNENLYTDVKTVAKIALLALPQIPSREVRNMERAPFYNAMGELNFMYDVVYISRLNASSLNGYKAVVVADVRYLSDGQIRILEKFKQDGGQILSVGSAENVRKTSSLTLPQSVIADILKPPVREEFRQAVIKVSGEPQVTVQNGPYVISNLVKQKSGRLIFHLVNYEKPVDNLTVKLDLTGVVNKVDPKSFRMYTPDDVPAEIKDLTVQGTAVSFTVPRLAIYNVVAFN